MIRSFSRVHAAVALAGVLLAPPLAQAQDDDECRVLQIDMTPAADLQIVVWLEDEAGNYVDTLYITRLTGSYGLGNRPGIPHFNSAWRWPYGPRPYTFPVWSHRHGMDWPVVVFQNGDESNLSHPLGQSSRETFYCRPLRDGEAMWDTQTCSSTIFTDKGVLSPTGRSLYPPRRDLEYVRDVDDESVRDFRALNPFDVVSRPTPPGDQPFQLIWPIIEPLPAGNYVIWVEVAKEWDHNSAYAATCPCDPAQPDCRCTNYPPPDGIPWGDYGLPARGQPSVIYQVPITIGGGDFVASSDAYAGYGDPGTNLYSGRDGGGMTILIPFVIDGDVRPPDETITTGVDGSGASRLLLTGDGEALYRVRVRSHSSDDETPPGVIDELKALDVSSQGLRGSFVAPGDDGLQGMVSGYEIRYLVARPLTEDNWHEAQIATTSIGPDEPGQVQLFDVGDLVPRTRYWIGVRAYDECRNFGPLTAVEVVTAEREFGEVPWCFVATAAYGSAMEQDVDMLRRFRDRFLRTHATGELLVAGYYTFGPALARVIESSDTLRRAARAGLAPIVERVRELSPGR